MRSSHNCVDEGRNGRNRRNFADLLGENTMGVLSRCEESVLGNASRAPTLSSPAGPRP